MPNYKLATRRAAEKYGVSPAILEALIQQESGFNPHARSPAGAQGIAQFMPGTAPGYGVNLHDNRVTDDLEGAAKYIAANLKRTGGNVKQALSIYNSGKPEGYKSIPETANYVRSILAGAKQFGGASHGQKYSGRPGTASSTTTTRTTPGIDNSGARAAAIQQFLGTKGSDPLQFALQIRGLQDVPGKTVTSSSSTPQAPSRAPSGGGSFAKGHSQLKELIHNTGSGPGYAVKNGQKVNGPQFYGGVWAGHQNHVHLAAGPKTVVALGKLAQQMGLHVGENVYFTGQEPARGVHAGQSYHYKQGPVGGGKVANEAIDVSGDPGKMNQFAARVERLYGLK